MSRISIKPLSCLFLLALTPPLSAQQPQVTLSGQVRPRYETRNPKTGPSGSFTSMRVRAALEAALDEGVRVFVQLQDVRFFGEEASTLGDFRADNIDLHQAFIQVRAVPGIGGALKVGRQELALGEQRLVGAVNWTQQGRSFDGVRYTTPGTDGFRLDLFGMKLREEAASAHETEAEFLGAWGTVGTGETGSLDLFALFTRDSRDEDLATEEHTFGALWTGDLGPIQLRGEGSIQRGTRGGEDVSAFMVGIRAGTRLSEAATVTLWYDYLSGDEDPDDGESSVFNTLFATNHAFYGFADYFLNIPVHTGGLGLRDAALKLSFGPFSGTRINVDLHDFRTAQEGSLSTQSLANEVDVTLSRPFVPGVGLAVGYSFVQAKDGLEELDRLQENAHWFYLMLNASF